MLLSCISENAQRLLQSSGVGECELSVMLAHGEFIDLPEGFIWLVDKGDCCRLMCESVNRPWSFGFVKKLRKMQKACDKPVYVESDDPSTIELCRKAGANVVKHNRAEWGFENV